MSYWGWGQIPDRYCRCTEDDDGESPLPEDPKRNDLPPLRLWSEDGARRYRA